MAILLLLVSNLSLSFALKKKFSINQISMNRESGEWDEIALGYDTYYMQKQKNDIDMGLLTAYQCWQYTTEWI